MRRGPLYDNLMSWLVGAVLVLVALLGHFLGWWKIPHDGPPQFTPASDVETLE